jgi:ribosomal protein L40E
VPIRFKIFGAGTCDWHGFILGGRTLDAAAKGGLGLRVTPDAYVLEGPGVVLSRCEEGGYERPDEAYGIQLWRLASVASSLKLRSVFDSDTESEDEVKEEKEWAPHVGCLVFSGDAMTLAPDEGAWIPVQRVEPPGTAEATSSDVEVVLASAGLGVEVVPGLWQTGSVEGLVFVGNATDFDQSLEKGDRVGMVARAAVQTRVCRSCGAEDSDAWVVPPGATGCRACGV